MSAANENRPHKTDADLVAALMTVTTKAAAGTLTKEEVEHFRILNEGVRTIVLVTKLKLEYLRQGSSGRKPPSIPWIQDGDRLSEDELTQRLSAVKREVSIMEDALEEASLPAAHRRELESRVAELRQEERNLDHSLSRRGLQA